MKPVFYHQRAQEQAEEIALWYEQQQEGLGDLFLNFLEETEEYIATYPRAFEKKRNNIRQGMMNKFPYLVMYAETETAIVIYSILHARQIPAKRFRK